MRIAIVHHWFVTRGGGERVAEVLGSLYPEADLFTLVTDASQVPQGLAGRRTTTSFLQSVPGAKRIHRYLLPLYPFAVEQLDLSAYDLVLTSDSGPMKGVIHQSERHPHLLLPFSHALPVGQLPCIRRAVVSSQPLHVFDSSSLRPQLGLSGSSTCNALYCQFGVCCAPHLSLLRACEHRDSPPNRYGESLYRGRSEDISGCWQTRTL